MVFISCDLGDLEEESALAILKRNLFYEAVL